MSSISAGTTSGTALVSTGDTTGTLDLKTGAGATTALSIDASQRVGIGTSSPTQKLDVSGKIRGYLNNTSVGNASSAQFVQDGTGDAAISFLIGATTEWLAGVDNSDSDSFKISNITGGGDFTSTGLTLTTSGVFYLGPKATNFSFTNGSAVDLSGSGTGLAGNGTNLTLGVWNGPIVFQAGNSGGALVERARIDSSGNVGIGTASPDALLTVNTIASFGAGAAGTPSIAAKGDLDTGMWFPAANTAAWSTGGTERMRFTSSGTIWKNYTTDIFTASGYQIGFQFDGNGEQGYVIKNTANSQNGAALRFVDYLGNYSGGGIYYTSSNSISYSTSSDYRLKENVAPMTGALEKVVALKPVTFNWKVDGLAGQGFIAHELAEVCPQAVVGKKDAIDKNGNPHYQAVDTSFLIATLTSATQELNEKVIALEAEIKALKGVA